MTAVEELMVLVQNHAVQEVVFRPTREGVSITIGGSEEGGDMTGGGEDSESAAIELIEAYRRLARKSADR